MRGKPSRFKNPHLVEISLVSHSLDKHTNAIRKIFGWGFDGLDLAIQERLQERIKPVEGYGDTAVQSQDPNEANPRYSAALSLNPSANLC